MFNLYHHGQQHVKIFTGRYADNDQLYVALEDKNGELYADLSVCISGIPLARDEFVFKTYSGNEGLLEAMMHTRRIRVVRIVNPTLGMLPVCRLT
ncbi:hypothetical protein RMSM_06616 [Rhodopirellula maiorica SM1]|uniref:Uncharacterized protein n=1 Tax=Rhodopirellula maiorica SM1 TaxID=1265738 RepID=M5RAD2_9BACT|nr:hypothetical protein [Rhodopirellula maiorica]EMI16458.1 hypothetical protein RMSM_06616 [Rhodopirellula maiorica SM1]